jgi:hypothetical protein
VTTASPTLTLGTVPSGKRWILRDWIFVQTQTGTARARLSGDVISGGIDRTVLMAQNDMIFRSQRHVVMNAGEILTLSVSDVTGTVTLASSVHGYELDAP